MDKPTAEDLEKLEETELLDLLDLVSGEVRRRNRLRRPTAGQEAVSVLRALGEIAKR